MFSLIFSRDNIDRILYLKVCGVKTCNSVVTWGTPIEYMLAKYFVDNLNEHRVPEEKLLDATHAFLAEIHKLRQIDPLTLKAFVNLYS